MSFYDQDVKPPKALDVDKLPTFAESYTAMVGNIAQRMKVAYEEGRPDELMRYHNILDRTEEAMAFRGIEIMMQSDSFWENLEEE